MTGMAPPDPLTDLALAVLSRAARHGSATVGVSRTRHGLTRFANSAVHQHVAEDTTEVRLRLTVEGRSATTTTTRLDEEGLDRSVDDTAALARLRPVDEHDPGPAPPAEVADTGGFDPGTAEPDPAARAGGVGEFVAADPDLSGAGYLDTEATEVAVVTTAGQRATAAATRATVDGIMRWPDDGPGSAGSAHQTARRLADLEPGAAGRRAARLARDARDPQDLEPGTYPVVLGPEAVATIAVFLGMYGFNAKQHLEGQSFVTLGQQQFDAAIHLTDDVTDPRSVGLAVDVEGTPRQRAPLIEGGTTVGLVHDRRTAARAGTTSTGHAVPGGDAFGPVPTDLVVAAGGAPPADLVADLDRGLLVTSFHYCRVLDPKTMVVTGLTRNGTFLVEDGKVAGPVSDLRFTQSFVAGLGPGRVRGVGSDDRYAASEIRAGAVIAPSLCLEGWSFTGGSRG